MGKSCVQLRDGFRSGHVHGILNARILKPLIEYVAPLDFLCTRIQHYSNKELKARVSICVEESDLSSGKFNHLSLHSLFHLLFLSLDIVCREFLLRLETLYRYTVNPKS